MTVGSIEVQLCAFRMLKVSTYSVLTCVNIHTCVFVYVDEAILRNSFLDDLCSSVGADEARTQM